MDWDIKKTSVLSWKCKVPCRPQIKILCQTSPPTPDAHHVNTLSTIPSSVTDTSLQQVTSAFHVSRIQSSKWSHSTLWSFRKVIKAPGGASGQESTCQCRRRKRHKFDPWVGKFLWSRKWKPTPVFLPGKFHGQRGLVGYSPWGRRVRHNWATKHTLI